MKAIERYEGVVHDRVDMNASGGDVVVIGPDHAEEDVAVQFASGDGIHGSFRLPRAAAERLGEILIAAARDGRPVTW